MTKITLRRIFSKHVLLKRTQFQLTQAQLAEAVGTSHGWIQKIESGKKMPGFFLAIKLAVFLEIDMNSFLKDLMEASGTPILHLNVRSLLFIPMQQKNPGILR